RAALVAPLVVARLGLLLACLPPRVDHSDRLHDEDEDSGRDGDELDHVRDEGAIAEHRVVDRERQRAEVRLPDDHRDDRHDEVAAAATTKPVVAYNIPGRVVRNIEPETITQLAEIPNLVAVKQANPDLDQARHIVDVGLDLYAGDDDLILPFLELGGRGGICV